MPRQLFDGSQPGPGRPQGSVSGRSRALQILDDLLQKSENQQALADAMQKGFERDPMRFFRTIIMPLLPRQATLAAASTEPVTIKWVSLLESFPKNGRERLPSQVPATQ